MKEAIYLFCGEEDFLKEEAESKLISSYFGPGGRKTAREKYAARDDCRDIFNALKTQSLLSDKRPVILTDIDAFPESYRPAFLDCLKDPPPHILLILRTSKTPFNDRFIKAVSRHAKTSLFKRLNKKDMRDWIYKRLKEEKVSINRDAVELLLELKGRSPLSILASELDKLVIYKEGGIIDEKDVAGLVGKSAARRAFDLVDAISFRKKDSAIALVRKISSGDRKDVPEMMGLLGWQFRKLWKAKRLLCQGKSGHDVARELNVRDFAADKFLSQAGRFSIEEIEKSFRLLCEADHSIKRGLGKPGFTLERLIIELCSA